ncbi:MAG TPA: DUF72 domain-containing protein [Usitatibacter sp.]|nr:DUF72 domain-containing protein [Usitatibacter sp.]
MIRIGISGWRYEGWRGVFYPEGLVQRRELEYAASRFSTVEISGTFYSLQRPECFEAWRRDTPDGFVFAVKGSRFITHMKKLRDIEVPLANFLASGIFNLREKLGPFLWQFPPNFRFDAARLEAFFELLPRDTQSALSLARRRDYRLKGRARLAFDANRKIRHAVEIRHESFRDPAFVRLLRRHGIALVIADTAGKWPLMEEVTADFVYMRLHGDKELYASGYSPKALERWAARIRSYAPLDAYCYFDNDAKVHAPFDAEGLMARLGLGYTAPHAREPHRPRRLPGAHRVPRSGGARPRHA